MPAATRTMPARAKRSAQPIRRPRALRVSLPPAEHAAHPLTAYQSAFHDWQAVLAYSERTIASQRHSVGRFIAWAAERGLNHPNEVTRPVLQRYQRHLHLYRKHNGEPLSISAQLNHLTALQAWFKWLTRQGHLLYNPAADLELPSRGIQLPKALLSISQISSILNACDTDTPQGIRLRALLELLYSSAIRRREASLIKTHDIDTERGALMVRQGKGRKDRYIPVGERACAWIERYQREVRSNLVDSEDERHSHWYLFVQDDGQPYSAGALGDLVKRHLKQCGVHHAGACHLFRVACATHMLEAGADIRFIQQLLGHANLDTTQIYTQVSLESLRAVHAATHPAKMGREAAPSPQNALQGANGVLDDSMPQPSRQDAARALLADLAAEDEESSDSEQI